MTNTNTEGSAVSETAATTKFQRAVCTRKPSLRSVKPAVRAKVIHTSRNKRQIQVFLTKPLMEQASLAVGGKLSVSWMKSEPEGLIRLTPAHSGLRATCPSKSSSTCRVAISGDFIAPAICAPVREVPFTILDSGGLLIYVPISWFANDMIRATAPTQDATIPEEPTEAEIRQGLIVSEGARQFPTGDDQ